MNLSELPDYDRACEKLELLEDGTTVIHRTIPKFIGHKIEGSDVALFHDEDGSWMVMYGYEGGPYKKWLFI